VTNATPSARNDSASNRNCPRSQIAFASSR
jgi:hypothetical protein